MKDRLFFPQNRNTIKRTTSTTGQSAEHRCVVATASTTCRATSTRTPADNGTGFDGTATEAC